jgi:hypothetical protein
VADLSKWRENHQTHQETRRPTPSHHQHHTISTMKAPALIFAALFLAKSNAFHTPTSHANRSLERSNDILRVRGGDAMSTELSSAIAPLSEALVSASPIRAVGALYSVAALTVVPLTLYRQAYSFSVGE